MDGPRTYNGTVIDEKVIQRFTDSDHPLTAHERAVLLAIFTGPTTAGLPDTGLQEGSA